MHSARLRTSSPTRPRSWTGQDAHEDADARATLADIGTRWGTTIDEHDQWLLGFVDFWGGTGAWKALRAEARDELRRVGWVVREGVRSLVGDTTRGATFGSVTAPTHLFSADRSPIVGQRVVQRLGEAMRGARVTKVPGVGHMGPVASAGIVNPLLLDAISAR
jgi:pimeloyl-ACP methyl ester carboxylesterase